MKRWTYKQAKELEVFADGEEYVVIDSEGYAVVVEYYEDDSGGKHLLELGDDLIPDDNALIIPVNSLI